MTKLEEKTFSKQALAAAALNFYDRVNDAISDLEVDPINELFNRRIDFALSDPLDRKELQANYNHIRAIEEKIEALGGNNPEMQLLLKELKNALWTRIAIPMRGIYKQGFRDGCILMFNLFEREKTSPEEN